MAITKSLRTKRREDESLFACAGSSRDGIDAIADARYGYTEGRYRIHVDHARPAQRQPDREATLALVRRRRADAGLQLPLATEESEYITSEQEYAQTLEPSVRNDSAKLDEALTTFQERMKHYGQERVYPTLPDWPVVCFYNMSKRRGEQRNWYALPYDERRKLMKGHASVGREFAGKVKQLITGSTGLDDAEWGVTLFAHDTFQIKAIVYKMRFDPVSAEYADFGEFYIGIQLPLDELFRRLQL